MERSAYALLKKMESSWWYKGRSRAVRAALRHAGVGKVSTALDYGAGYGGMYATLARVADTVDGFEPDAEARAAAAARGYRHLFSEEAPAFAEHPKLIGLFDVLEHIEDDRAFLVRAQQALAAGSRIAVTVPASMSLWSAHDVEHHHFRRYTKAGVKKLFTETGYEVEYASYWNCALSIPAGLLRLLGKTGEGGLTPAAPVAAILTFIVTIEAMLLRYLPLLFGLSIVLVARKK